MKRFGSRRALGVVLWLGICAFPAASAAAKPARECIAAHADGQVDRDAGRLLSARQRFLTCAAEHCPAMIRKECAELNGTVEQLTPSVVLAAEDTRGRDLVGARAHIDDGREVPTLDGRPLALDPGEHWVELVLRDGRRQRLLLTLRETEKYRRVVATFPASELAPAPREASVLPYVLAGVGVLALGSFGVFGLDGKHKQTELERCAPHCPKAAVSAMRKSYAIADVSLGLSLIALGASTYLFVGRGREASTSASAVGTVWVGATGDF